MPQRRTQQHFRRSGLAALRQAVHLLVLPPSQRAPGFYDHHTAQTSAEPPHTVTLDSFQSTQQAAQAFQAYYSASTPEGLFAPLQTSVDAQDALLAALDRQLSQDQQFQGDGAAGDGASALRTSSRY